eukprot:g4585.t1
MTVCNEIGGLSVLGVRSWSEQPTGTDYRYRQSPTAYDIMELRKQTELTHAYKGNFTFAHDLFFRYFRIPQAVTSDVERLTAQLPRGCLSLHYRGSDKQFGYLNEATTIHPDEFLMLVEHFVERHPEITTLFIASDEHYFMKQAAVKFPRLRIVSQDIRRGKGGNRGMHHKHHFNGPAHGRQALVDAIMLGKCRYLLKTSSALSGWSKIFTPSVKAYRVQGFNADWFPDANIPLYWPPDEASRKLSRRVLQKDFLFEMTAAGPKRTLPNVGTAGLALLRKAGVDVREVESIQSDGAEPRWIDQLTKLRYFSWTDFEQVAFIDADHYIHKCIDDAFDVCPTQPFCCCEERWGGSSDVMVRRSFWKNILPQGKMCNMGFFVARTSKSTFERMMSHGVPQFQKHGTAWDWHGATMLSEQEYLNVFFREKRKVISTLFNVPSATHAAENGGRINFTPGMADEKIRTTHCRFWAATHCFGAPEWLEAAKSVDALLGVTSAGYSNTNKVKNWHSHRQSMIEQRERTEALRPKKKRRTLQDVHLEKFIAGLV